MGTADTNPFLEIRFRIPFDRIRAAGVEPAAASLLRDARARLRRGGALPASVRPCAGRGHDGAQRRDRERPACRGRWG